jgi:hypothetical protein
LEDGKWGRVLKGKGEFVSDVEVVEVFWNLDNLKLVINPSNYFSFFLPLSITSCHPTLHRFPTNPILLTPFSVKMT